MKKKIVILMMCAFEIVFLTAFPERLSASITWVQKSDSPIWMNDHDAGVIGSMWYHAGGYTQGGVGQRISQAYNLQTDEWSSMAYMNNPHRGHGVVAYDGKLYAFGGCSDAGSFHPELEVYDPGSGSWSNLTSMPVTMRYFGYALSGDRIYVTGGEGAGQYYPHDSFWIYDISDDVWNSGPAMPIAVVEPSSTEYDGKIYTFGGRDLSMHSTNLIQIYDIATATWSVGTSMPIAASEASATVLDNMIYVLGGYSDIGYHASLQIYDPMTATWTLGTDMLEPDVHEAAFNAYDGKLYVYYNGKTYVGIPEPATVLLLGLGGLVLRRRKRM